MLLSTALTCSPPNSSNIDTAIADTGATGHYFRRKAPVTNINHNALPTTVSIANGDLVHSSATASLTLPHLPPGTDTGLIMPTFANNLLSMGVFCDAGCYVVFTKVDVLIYDSTHKLIMRGLRETHGARMWRFSLTNAIAANSTHSLSPNIPTIIPPNYDEDNDYTPTHIADSPNMTVHMSHPTTTSITTSTPTRSTSYH